MAKKERKSETDSTPQGKPSKELPEPISEEAFEGAFDLPGMTKTEGRERLTELMQAAESGETEGLQGPDRELVQAARDRLKETGSKEDAIRALTMEMEAQRADEAGHGPEPEPVPFEKLAEETGLSPDTLTVTAKVDGEEVEIPLSEAVQGYQRQKDYTRKTQELSEQREEVGKIREAYAQRLEMLAVGLGRNLSPEQQEALVSEYNRVATEVEGQMRENLSATVEEEQGKLRESFGWEDDSEWDEARGQLREYAHSLGYSDEQLSGVHDHRLLSVLEKARRWEEAQSRSKEVREKTRAEKKPIDLQPGTRTGRPSRVPATQKARERLKKTGSKRDAEVAIASILGTD